jgi:hypothetical protein
MIEVPMKMASYIGMLFVVAQVSAAQTPLQPEEAPAGVKFLATAATWEELAAPFRANLSWRDQDGAQLFVRIEDSPTLGEPEFHLNSAYYVRQNARSFWAFLDPSSGEGRDAQDSVREFMVLHHVLEVVHLVPPGHLVGAHRSSASVLARRDDGAIVYKLVYASHGGKYPQMRGYLLFRSPAGDWQLAMNDSDGRLADHSGRFGREAISDSTDIQIVWTPNGPAPFRADLETITWHSPGGEYGFPEYSTSQEGALEGAFPLRLQLSARLFYLPDGDYTIRKLADTLLTYHSDWIDEDWVASPENARRQVEALWIQAIQRLNPGIDADALLTPDRQIELPDESPTGRAILDQLRERVKK